MINEDLQDLAAEYAIDALDPESARAFEALLADNPELKMLAEDLREAAAAMVHTVPAHFPPPDLRERVMGRIRAEAQAIADAPVVASVVLPGVGSAVETPVPMPKSGGTGFVPWALAAGFAVTTAGLWTERTGLQRDRNSLIQEANELRNRDSLAKVKIAMLAAQVDAYSKASVVIVWDAEKQHGIVKMANVPQPAPGKDYQLWVIDPKYPQPVNGGMVTVDSAGLARVSFTPDQPVGKVDKFAISVEPTGGVPKATGPIVLLGGT